MKRSRREVEKESEDPVLIDGEVRYSNLCSVRVLARERPLPRVRGTVTINGTWVRRVVEARHF